MNELCKEHANGGFYDSTADCYVCELEAENKRLKNDRDNWAQAALDKALLQEGPPACCYKYSCKCMKKVSDGKTSSMQTPRLNTGK